MTAAEELELRRYVQRTARRLGLLRGAGWFFMRPLMELNDSENEAPLRRERDRLDEPGCSRAFNPAGLK